MAGARAGMPEAIPVRESDYIFTVIGEEFGLIFGIIVILFYLVFIGRGILIALNARSTYDALLVFGCTAMLSLQSFIIIGGVIKLILLTGVTLPYISYGGGSSLLSSMIQLGIIQGVAIKNGQRDEEELAEMGGEIIILRRAEPCVGARCKGGITMRRRKIQAEYAHLVGHLYRAV